jgi:hypothetical protein
MREISVVFVFTGDDILCNQELINKQLLTGDFSV